MAASRPTSRGNRDRLAPAGSARPVAIATMVAVLATPFLGGCNLFGWFREEPAPSEEPLIDPHAKLITTCPVTGRQLTLDEPGVVTYVYEGRTYLFADLIALEEFKTNPRRYLAK